jgi:FHIPEP family
VDLAIELPARLKPLTQAVSSEGYQFEICVRHYAEDLLHDLALRGDVSLIIREKDEKDGPGQETYRIWMNGRECRLRWPAVIPEGLSPRDVAGLVSTAVHANRDLLVTPELAQGIARSWSIEQDKDRREAWSAEAFQAYIAALVRRNFSIEKGRERAIGNTPRARNPMEAGRCFDEATAHQPTRLSLLRPGLDPRPVTDAPQDQQAACSDPFFRELGLVLPKLRIETDTTLRKDEFRVRLNDVRLPAPRGLRAGEFVVNRTPQELAKLGVKARSILEPLKGDLYTLVSDGEGNREICGQNGLAIWEGSPETFQMIHLGEAVRRNAGSLLTSDLVEFMLDQLSESSRDLVEAVQRRYEPQTTSILVGVLRDLLDEQVPVRDLSAILQSLLAIRDVSSAGSENLVLFSSSPPNSLPLGQGKSAIELDTADYSTAARIALRPGSRKFALENEPVLFKLDPQIEQRLMEVPGSPLQEDECCRLRQAVLRAWDSRPAGQLPVIVTWPQIRKQVEKLIEHELPELSVLSLAELPPAVLALVLQGPPVTISW